MLRDSGPRPEQSWWYWAIWVAFITLFEGFAALCPPQGAPRWVYLSPLLYIGMAIGLVPLDRASRRRERARLTTLPPVCLACVYDLTGVPTDPDGCTVCPECGAAWKLAPRDPPAPDTP